MIERSTSILIGAALAALSIAPAQAEGWLKDPVSGCALWQPEDPTTDELVSWSGACVDGKAEGRGVGTWTDSEGLLGRFEGTMRAGKAIGTGILDIRDEKDPSAYHRFLGQFEDGMPSGEGMMDIDGGYVLRGKLLDGLAHMEGTVISPEGNMVRGEFKDGKVIGEAFAYYVADDQSVYLGDVLDGEREGHGMLQLPNEDYYLGEFKAGEADGYGTYHAESGEYVGVFAKGDPNGPGTFVATDGKITQGRFVDGKPDGLVLVTLPDGTQTTETWKNGEKAQ
jgi:hypothetical protein